MTPKERVVRIVTNFRARAPEFLVTGLERFVIDIGEHKLKDAVSAVDRVETVLSRVPNHEKGTIDLVQFLPR